MGYFRFCFPSVFCVFLLPLILISRNRNCLTVLVLVIPNRGVLYFTWKSAFLEPIDENFQLTSPYQDEI